MLYRISTEFKKYEDIASAKALIEDLEKHKEDISALDLSFNTFTPPVFAEISKIIAEMKNLRHVRLESIVDSLTFEEMSAVLSALSDALTRDLSALELPSNALSCNFPAAFGKLLSECPLTVLDLYNCGLGEEGLIAVTERLAALQDKTRLQVLNLSKNRINKITPALAPLLNEFTALTDLRIRNNTIEETSMSAFLDALEGRGLRTLDLSDNFVCGASHAALGRLFQRADLAQLYLQDAKMDDGGLNVFLELCNRKALDELPGGIQEARPVLDLDISCLDFAQDAVPLLEELATKYQIQRLVVFENAYEDVAELRRLVKEAGGVFVEEEEQEEEPGIDGDIVEKLKVL